MLLREVVHRLPAVGAAGVQDPTSAAPSMIKAPYSSIPAHHSSNRACLFSIPVQSPSLSGNGRGGIEGSTLITSPVAVIPYAVVCSSCGKLVLARAHSTSEGADQNAVWQGSGAKTSSESIGHNAAGSKYTNRLIARNRTLRRRRDSMNSQSSQFRCSGDSVNSVPINGSSQSVIMSCWATVARVVNSKTSQLLCSVSPSSRRVRIYIESACIVAKAFHRSNVSA
jgi:hypothetical protein